MTILPAGQYRDPLIVLVEKERSIENRVRGCKGCRHLQFDASGARIIANCARGRKVGRKGKCSIYKEFE